MKTFTQNSKRCKFLFQIKMCFLERIVIRRFCCKSLSRLENCARLDGVFFFYRLNFFFQSVNRGRMAKLSDHDFIFNNAQN